MYQMPSVIVIGGGLAGLSAAAALGSAGFRIEVFEARPFLGGRATSFPLAPSDEASELIDNCQHVLLRCCVNLLDFYGRLGVRESIRFYREFYFIEPGGRVSTLRRGVLPAPLHFTESFLRLRFLDAGDKLAIARGLMALRRERNRRDDLDRITMLDWLREKRQTQRAIERFWRQVLVSAINEDIERMAARHGFQVFWLGFLARADAYEMGVPRIKLGELYRAELWHAAGDVSLRLRAPVERIDPGGIVAGGERHTADYYVCALPFERLPALGLPAPAFEHSPITGIHLWFNRSVTDLPHATLLDRTVQWMFNKSEGRYLQLVVSAARGLAATSRADIVALALAELGEFFPRVREARLEKAHVIKELRATFSPAPGAEELRPPAETNRPDLFLAGDWTNSGWPATMEGAVRSGYLAAEAVARSSGRPARFLLPDIA
ncbi:MAG TPA: hydroxysqualene dehydroxylase HpnE [Bryobacteraceae bacterium]|nr:hydroxysqualene dehydroxylase HpnE [Bryobacteraceae bacterium]